jgi:hypothetical protein
MAEQLYWFITATSTDGKGTTRHFWGDKKVREGDRITVKDDEPDREWYVVYVGTMSKTKHMLGEQSGWHVGGL